MYNTIPLDGILYYRDPTHDYESEPASKENQEETERTPITDAKDFFYNTPVESLPAAVKWQKEELAEVLKLCEKHGVVIPT